MTTIERPLADLVRDLPPDMQAQVRDFVEFLLQKRGHSGALHSALDVLDEAPGEGVFRTGDEVRRYLDEERASWER